MKEKFVLDERQKGILYSVLLVAVLILLAFGDQIALRFIAKNPNPNNKVFGDSDRVINESDYKIDFMSELSLEELLAKIEKKETFVVLSSRSSCETCELYLPILKEIMDTYHFEGYYINRSLYENNSPVYRKLQNLDIRLQEHLTYTPYFMLFKDGVLKDELVGRKKKSEVEDFVIRNDLANL